jgi:hypothetical protein
MYFKRSVNFKGNLSIQVMLIMLCLIACSGCAAGPKPIFYWGDYDNCLYSHYSNNEDEKSFESMKTIVTKAEKDNLRIAPGIYAEYGFMLYNHGQPAMAVQYFKLEEKNYPESAPLMQQLIARIEKKQEEKAKDAGATPNGATGNNDFKPSGGNK